MMGHVLLSCVALCLLTSCTANEEKAVDKVARIQKFRVTGQFTCNGDEVPHHTVLLRDHNKVLPDDTLAQGQTDEDGYFEICGEESAIFTIVPYVRVKHKCNVPLNCYRVSDYYVPDEDVSTGEYDFDQLDLRALAKDDKKVCN